jgi:hypothetical protein
VVQPLRHSWIVRGDHDLQPVTSTELDQYVGDPVGVVDVECTGRLVRQEDGATGKQSAGDGDPLLLAPDKLAGSRRRIPRNSAASSMFCSTVRNGTRR